MKICSVENCNYEIRARGWCERHYKYWIRRGEPKPLGTKRCSVNNCNNKNAAKGLCARHYYVVRKYGITPFQFEEMLTKQSGVCAICGNKCTSGKDLAVDHCHETGRVRGLLCQSCNWGLGNFKDDINLLNRAIVYLSNARE